MPRSVWIAIALFLGQKAAAQQDFCTTLKSAIAIEQKRGGVTERFANLVPKVVDRICEDRNPSLEVVEAVVSGLMEQEFEIYSTSMLYNAREFQILHRDGVIGGSDLENLEWEQLPAGTYYYELLLRRATKEVVNTPQGSSLDLVRLPLQFEVFQKDKNTSLHLRGFNLNFKAFSWVTEPGGGSSSAGN